MPGWPKNELRKIAETDRLTHRAVPRGRCDVWYGDVDLVRCGKGDLYVRAYNGPHSRWCLAAVKQSAGRITAAGMTKEVAFEPVDGALNDRIDEAYRAKYKDSPYLKPMIGSRARSATVKISRNERVTIPPAIAGPFLW